MSNYWSIHCKTCNKFSADDINHGNNILRDIVKTFPYIKVAQDTCERSVDVRIDGYGTDEAFSFLREHEGHEIDLADEYGKFESVEVPSD